MRVGVNLHQTMATAWCRRVRCCLGVRTLCSGAADGCRTGYRRTFRLEQIASENLAGDGEGLVAVSAFLRLPFALGVATGEAPGDAVGLAAEARALDSERFRELSTAFACATVGTGCLIPFWDA
jgi:hypothetical protein